MYNIYKIARVGVLTVVNKLKLIYCFISLYCELIKLSVVKKSASELLIS